MERYSEYKDSGIYYIKTIPSKWNVLKAKYLFKQEKRSVRKEDEVVTCFRDGQVTLRKNRRIEGFTNSEKEIGYQGIRKGDLVIHNMDAFAGAIGVSDSDGKSTPVYSVCTPITKNINVYYYSYLMRSLSREGFILSLAKGIRERSTDFRYSDFKELLLPVPSLDEQNTIVNYIQAKTSQLDEAIAQQQRMIDLLNERKQIIIQHAVTKGLDPNAEMVDSGVEWIGMMPKGWKYLPLKRCCSLVRDKALYNQINRISLENIISWTGNYIKTNSVYEGNGILYKKNDVLFGKLRPYLAKVLLAKSEGEALGDFWVMRPTDHILPNYLKFVFLCYGFIELIDSTTYGAKMPRADWNTNSKAQIPVPSIIEQHNICEKVNRVIENINSIINQNEYRITLLRERKQIIINEVVTGKVKVS